MVNYNLSRQKKYENLKKQIFFDKNGPDGYVYMHIHILGQQIKLVNYSQSNKYHMHSYHEIQSEYKRSTNPLDDFPVSIITSPSSKGNDHHPHSILVQHNFKRCV